ncbi:MAG TPA: hypothetical protein VIY27_08240 [Myxococcota bacterium]
MAIYEPQPELLVSNFPDVLMGELESLEMMSAFAIEPEPGRTKPRPASGDQLRSSRDLARTIAASGIEPGSLVGLALNAKLRALHMFEGPLATQTRAGAVNALRGLEAATVLGGGTQLVIVRYQQLPWKEETHGDALAGDEVLKLVQEMGGFLPAEVLDFVWVDPSGKYVGALDVGLL